MADNQARRIEAELVQFVGRAVGQLQLVTLQTISSAMPVDTGFARAGTTPSVGSALTRELERPGDREAARAQARTRFEANLSRARQIAETYKVSLGPAFLSNNVGYVPRLNEGYSAQAGSKFIERAIEDAIRAVSRSL
jgi:hypothetical protein